jgi:hypothetical protein
MKQAAAKLTLVIVRNKSAVKEVEERGTSKSSYFELVLIQQCNGGA